MWGTEQYDQLDDCSSLVYMCLMEARQKKVATKRKRKSWKEGKISTVFMVRWIHGFYIISKYILRQTIR